MRRFVFAQAQLFILIWTTGGSGAAAMPDQPPPKPAGTENMRLRRPQMRLLSWHSSNH